MIDTNIYQDGEWFKPITPREAFDMRLDVQLYATRLPLSIIVPDNEPPEEWRKCKERYGITSPYNSFNSSYWRDPHLQWFIKVEPAKPEYTPEQRSNEVATTSTPGATTRCDRG